MRKIRMVSFPFPEGERNEVIDVRSPSEFLEDHITDSINLPVLSDDERTRVGTLYRQVSAFEARKTGAALVSRNIAKHLDNHFAEKPKDYRAILYCWRGGQRSGSFATVLHDVGWQVSVLEGGYRSYRRAVIERISEVAPQLNLVVLNGYTGSGKTLVLKAMRDLGAQVMDLEGMASHKGSVFGGDPGFPQPAQKRFESLIHDEMSHFDPGKPLFVEAESSKIGRLNLPNPLWQAMKAAPVVELHASIEARAAYITRDYADWLGDLRRVEATLERLRGFHSHAMLAEWKALAGRGEWFALVEWLLRDHYDRLYTVSGSGHFQAPSTRVDLLSHDKESVRRCALEVIKHGAGSLVGRSARGTSEPLV